MIKATMETGEGKNVLVLGISAENVIRLKEGKPIHITGEELGLECDVLLVYGETESQIYQDLQPMMGADTSVEPVIKTQTIQ